MDSTKRDLIDRILSLAETEPTVAILVEDYCKKYNKTKREVIQGHINDLTMDIIEKQIRYRKEYEGMVRKILSKDNYILNMY